MFVYVCSYFIIEPDFVSSIEDEEYVYFFFRESAVEHINCGKVTLFPQSNWAVFVFDLMLKICNKSLSRAINMLICPLLI